MNESGVFQKSSISICTKEWPDNREPFQARNLLSALLFDSNDAITVQDFEGHILAWNRGAELMYGYSEAEALGGDVLGVMHEARRQHAPSWAERLRRGEAVSSFEMQRAAKDGRTLDVGFAVSAILDEAGNARAILTTERDITVRRETQAVLNNARAESERRYTERTSELQQTNEHLLGEKELFQVTLACMGDAVITTDVRGNIKYLNPVAEKLTGWRSVEALGLPLPQVFEILVEATRKPAADPVTSCLREGKVKGLDGDTLLIRRNGQELAIDDTAAPIFNIARELIGAVLIFRDITEKRRLVQQLAHQAVHDALTGLMNRREFERCLNRVMASRSGHESHRLLYLDLDQFKIVNDTCGHVVGDALLRQISALLRSKVRELDTVARLGGDEFGILLEHCSKEQACRVANELRQAIQDFRFLSEDKSFPIAVSIGVVSIEAGQSLSTVLSAADSACYVAKERGRNRVHIYEPDNAMAQRLEGMHWIRRIQNGLGEDRFRLYHQPIVSLKSNEKESDRGEILLRMLDEEGHLVLPDIFIPAAERYDQMVAIDRWVVCHSFRAMRSRGAAAPLVTYFINMSGQSLGDHQFLDFVIDELSQAAVHPSSVCFEITETAAIANLTNAIRFISSLRERGCQFALDDFGMGLSSFAYLRTLPVDYLKIAGPFIATMVNDPINHAIVEAVHHIGHVMGIKTIAESVDDDATLEKLKVMGVDYAQGNRIGRVTALRANVVGAG
jgi:diguanylate cyclase (GGDEF)-like protein/PAS domain S-box-containing protein